MYTAHLSKVGCVLAGMRSSGQHIPCRASPGRSPLTTRADMLPSRLPGVCRPPRGRTASRRRATTPAWPGFRGPTGTDGTDGFDGARGPSGRVGATGMKGMKGAIGTDGSNGVPAGDAPQGLDGEAGDPGTPGVPGRDGAWTLLVLRCCCCCCGGDGGVAGERQPHNASRRHPAACRAPAATATAPFGRSEPRLLESCSPAPF